MSSKKWLSNMHYRLGQVCQQLGFVASPTDEDYQEVARWLPASGQKLFRSMTYADQQHSLRVCRGLQARGCWEEDMLAAALLHDVGKGEGRVPFWTRPALVLGKRLFPNLLKRAVVAPSELETGRLLSWQRSLSYAWWHAEVGAELALSAGLSERTVLYIRTHHQRYGPASPLHLVDEVS